MDTLALCSLRKDEEGILDETVKCPMGRKYDRDKTRNLKFAKDCKIGNKRRYPSWGISLDSCAAFKQ